LPDASIHHLHPFRLLPAALAIRHGNLDAFLELKGILKEKTP
jgi:hypothetical protein